MADNRQFNSDKPNDQYYIKLAVRIFIETLTIIAIPAIVSVYLAKKYLASSEIQGTIYALLVAFLISAVILVPRAISFKNKFTVN